MTTPADLLIENGILEEAALSSLTPKPREREG